MVLSGQPLAGVNVVIKGTSRGVVTDANGQFNIDVERGKLLVFSSVGYLGKEVKISSSALAVELQINNSPLDEIQIVAYGTQSKRLQTGNVSTVTAEEIKKQPVSNPLLALQGRVPGLNITQNSGVAGGGVSVQIRGQNSIVNGNDPLFVIDGVPYTSQLLPNLGSNILGQTNGNRIAGSGNSLNFINPSDIENISILKDADATAIYGSRGANGVILITTKKGKAGKSKVDINISAGVGKIPKKLDLLNTQEYLQMRKEAFKNDGEIPTAATAPDLLVWDSAKYTDWQKVLIGGNSNYTNIGTSISGGNSNVQYLLGGTYHSETAVFPGDFSNKKAAVHFNLGTNSTNGKFKTSLSANYVNDNNSLPQVDLAYTATTFAPNAPDVFNPDGTLNWADNTWPGANPAIYTKLRYNIRADNLVSNINLSYNLLKGLNISTNLGYTNMQINETNKTPISASNPAFLPITGRASFTNNNIRSWIAEPQLTYQLIAGNNKFDFLAGATFQQNRSEGSIINGTGYTSDALLGNIQAAPNKIYRSITSILYKYNAFLED